MERAADRVQELRACVRVWKGTGEEKARGKFVDGLEALVEEERMKRDRRSVEVRRNEAESNVRRSREEGRPSGVRPTGARSGGEAGSGPGFLQRLREEIYME